MVRGWFAYTKLIDDYDFDRVLDVGAGDGEHAKAFYADMKHVVAIDLKPPPEDLHPDIWWREGLFEDLLPTTEKYPVVWCCHVMEHQRNIGSFLDGLRGSLLADGTLALTVPVAKADLVGGHVTVWNGGLLLYNLVLGGFDCSRARLIQRNYDISVLVPVAPAGTMPELDHDRGDITKLVNAGLLPQWFYEGMNADDVAWLNRDIGWGPIQRKGDHDSFRNH